MNREGAFYNRLRLTAANSFTQSARALFIDQQTLIHRALNSIPAKPVMIIAPVMVLLVLGLYYWNRNIECTARSEQRIAFIQKIDQAATSNSILNLADVAEFPWQQVKGFIHFKPQHRKASCPFNWDWPGDDRQAVIEAGLLSLLIFFNEGAVSNYIEFRGDKIIIDEFEDSLTREEARFSVEKQSSPDIVYRLTLLP